jgi:Nicotianamine synthase protein
LFSLSCFNEWDVIFVNALVGVDTDNYLVTKQGVIEHILTHCASGTLLVLRSSYRTGQWIYPQVDQSWFASYPSTVITPPTPERSALIVVEC